MTQPVHAPSSAPPAGPYSPAMRCGDLLFVSGQGPFDADGQRIGDTFAEQADAVFDNVAALALAAGTSLGHVVRLGAYLSDHAYFGQWNEACLRRLRPPYPARTTVPVALPGFDLEVDAVLWVPGAGDQR